MRPSAQVSPPPVAPRSWRADLIHGLARRQVPGVASRNARVLYVLGRARILLNDYNSALGMTWSVLGPAALWVVLYAIFQRRFGQGIAHYPVFLMVGIVVINYFTTATTVGMNTLLGGRDLVLNSFVLPEVLVAAELARHAVKMLVELTLCLIVAAALGVLGPRVFLVIPAVAAVLAFSAATVLVLAILRCWVDDFGHLWGLATRLLLFATPVVYDLSSISQWAAGAVYWLNPLTPLLMNLRSCLIDDGAPLSWFVFAHAMVLGVASVPLALGFVFALEERTVERV